MEKKVKTPFGSLIVLLNGKEYEYEYTIVKIKNVDVYQVEINLSNCKINDVIECFVENSYLKYYDSDERCDLLSIVNDNYTLGVCGYEPQYHEIERLNYCYELDNYMDGKFVYKVYRNPNDYANKESCVTKIKVCCLNNKDYEDTEETLFDILC